MNSPDWYVYHHLSHRHPAHTPQRARNYSHHTPFSLNVICIEVCGHRPIQIPYKTRQISLGPTMSALFSLQSIHLANNNRQHLGADFLNINHCHVLSCRCRRASSCRYPANMILFDNYAKTHPDLAYSSSFEEHRRVSDGCRPQM